MDMAYYICVLCNGVYLQCVFNSEICDRSYPEPEDKSEAAVNGDDKRHRCGDRGKDHR